MRAVARLAVERPQRHAAREIGWPRARLSHHLAVLADAGGDVDAYIEAVTLGAREHIDAAGVAERLLAASRPEEALAWVKIAAAGRLST
jgi:hypothetical protein